MATNTAQTQAHGGAKPRFRRSEGNLRVPADLARAVLRRALSPDVARRAAARRRRSSRRAARKIEDDLAEANRLKEETEAAIAAYEKTLADARANAQAIGAKTRDELMAEADKRRKTLEDQLDRKLEEAEKTIAATKTAAMGNVRGIATDAAAAIVERLIGQAPSEKAVSDAVADALKR